VFCSATPLQYAMIPAFKMPHDYFDSLRQQYRVRRDTLCQELKAVGFECQSSQGSYFLAADYRKLNKQFANKDDLEVALTLTREAGVASVPFSAFYPADCGTRTRKTGFLRFAFCKDISVLLAAGEKLKSYIR